MNNSSCITVSSRSKVVFLELLRIIACFCVIVNHTAPDVFLTTTPSVDWFVSLFYFYASKVAVPIFLMISGYTMLDRLEDYKKSFLRFFRIVCSLGFFSAIYFVAYYLDGAFEHLSIISFFEWLLPGPMTNAYWYLYMYLGLLLMMPFLQKLVSVMKKEDFHVFFLCSGVLYSFWPLVVHYFPKLTYNGYFSAPLFFGELALLFWGCYLKRYSVPSTKGKVIAVVGFLGCCLLNTVLTYFEYHRMGGANYLFLDYYQHLPIILEGLCVFYFVSTLSFGQRSAKALVFLGSLTFGIYLMSDLLNKYLYGVYLSLSQLIRLPVLSLLPYELLIFIAGGVIALILKQIPIIKKLL